MKNLNLLKKYCQHFFLLMLVVSAPVNVFAGTISIVSDDISYLASKDGKGLYWDIMQMIFKPAGYTVKTMTVPLARALHMVKNNEVDGVLNVRFGELEGILYPEMHYATALISVLCRKESFNNWKGEYSLAYKTVGIIRKNNYHAYLYIPVKLYEVNNRSSGIMMTANKRIDCFVDSRFELLLEMKRLPTNIRNALEVRDVFTIKQYIGFSDTKKGRALMDVFDRGIKAAIASGELRKLFKKWNYRPFPFNK